MGPNRLTPEVELIERSHPGCGASGGVRQGPRQPAQAPDHEVARIPSASPSGWSIDLDGAAVARVCHVLGLQRSFEPMSK